MFSESSARRVRFRIVTMMTVEAEFVLCSMSLEITPPVKFFIADIARVALERFYLFLPVRGIIVIANHCVMIRLH